MAVETKKRRFSLACTLLSRMVRERRGCFNNGAQHRPAAAATMDLLAGMDVPAETRAAECTGPAPAGGAKEEEEDLTIFYGGGVFVFGDFPEEGAEVLVRMAESAGPESRAATGRLRRGADVLAQTRKDSLHRFLSKRKERINATAPYRVRAGSLKKKMGAMAMAMAMQEETRPWLALGQ